MPRWTIEGADRATGDERHFNLDAPTERDAMLAAKSKNVLVSSVKLVEGSDAPEIESADTGKPKPERPVSYSEILAAAGWLVAASNTLKVFSVLAFIAAALSVLVTITGHEPSRYRFAGITGAAIEAFAGVAFMGGAAFLNMCAHAGKALRDIAIENKISDD